MKSLDVTWRRVVAALAAVVFALVIGFTVAPKADAALVYDEVLTPAACGNIGTRKYCEQLVVNYTPLSSQDKSILSFEHYTQYYLAYESSMGGFVSVLGPKKAYKQVSAVTTQFLSYYIQNGINVMWNWNSMSYFRN